MWSVKSGIVPSGLPRLSKRFSCLQDPKLFRISAGGFFVCLEEQRRNAWDYKEEMQISPFCLMISRGVYAMLSAEM